MAARQVKPLPTLAASAGTGAFACVSRAWQAHEAELRGFLVHGLGDAQAAEDVLQDTFIKAMREGQGFCSLDNPRAWLFRVARNAMTDRHRLAKSLDRIEDHADTLRQPEAELPPAVDALTACLDRVLGELSVEHAEVLRACDIAGTTQKDFALAQGLTLPATKSRLLRARRRLRDRMALACRVQFDPEDGRVSGFAGRADEKTEPGCR
jgi:RNA polymerase sigma-70 factor (ECF subfamily)